MYLAERLEPVVGQCHPDRPRPAGRRRPRVRRRGDPDPRAPGPARGLSGHADLVAEILLRLAKAARGRGARPARLRRRDRPRRKPERRSSRCSRWLARCGLHPARRDEPDLTRRDRPACPGPFDGAPALAYHSPSCRLRMRRRPPAARGGRAARRQFDTVNGLAPSLELCAARHVVPRALHLNN